MARPILKRSQIETGVVEVVARKGLHATTIQDIAGAAEVSPGLLYRYWENRDALAGDVYRVHMSAMIERLKSAAAGERTVAGRLRAMIATFLDFADQQPTLLKFLLLSQHDLAPTLPQPFSVHTLLRGLIEDGIRRKQFLDLPPDLAANFVMGLVLQPAVGCIYGTLARPLRSHLDAIWRAVTRVLILGTNP